MKRITALATAILGALLAGGTGTAMPAPGPPPVLTILAPTPIYEYSKISLKMQIDHFPFDEVDVDALPHQLGDFVRLMQISQGKFPRDKDGGVTFQVMGYFIGTGSSVELRLTSPRKSDATRLHVSASITKSALTTYKVTNTWSLRDGLAPRLLGSGLGAFCDGTPPIGSPLGALEENGKLTFFGRSGPVGTACSFGLKEMLARSGVIGASWKVVKGGPGEQCKASANFAFGAGRGTVQVGEGGSFIGEPVLFSDSRQVSDGGVVFATDNTDPVTVLRPTIIQYSCPITLGSDVRTIRFVLDSVTMLAPPGRTFP